MFLPKLTVKVGVVVGIHAAFECFGIVGPVEEPRRDAQRADPVTGSSCRADFIGLAFRIGSPRTRQLPAI